MDGREWAGRGTILSSSIVCVAVEDIFEVLESDQYSKSLYSNLLEDFKDVEKQMRMMI
jgi:hypothetical protein